MAKKEDAKNKASKSKDPKKQKSKALVNVKSELEKYAQETLENEKDQIGAIISIKNGKFMFGEDELPQPLNVIIVDNRFENAFYTTAYDPDNPQPPGCYAIGTDQDELVPAEDSPAKQADSCFDCPMNEWGSADVGRGKACRNLRRLALIPADDLEGITVDTEPASMRIAPTGLSGFSGLFKKVAKALRLPPFGVVTALETEQNGNYFVVKPKLVGPIEDNSLLQTILTIRESSGDMLEAGYDFSNYELPTKKKKIAPKKGGKKKSGKF